MLQQPSRCLPSASRGGEESSAAEAATAPACLGLKTCRAGGCRKLWQEPSPLLSSLSAGLCSAQALGVPQGKGTGVAHGAVDGAPVSAGGYRCSCSSLPGLDEAVGCCEDPLRADEGPSARMPRACCPEILDADDPGPGPCLGVCAPHHARGAVISSHGPEPAGPSATRNSSPSCSTARCCPS